MTVIEGTSRTLASEPERFEAVYSQCATAVLAYLLRRMPESDAKDVAADTFAVVWRRQDELPEAPLAWVLGIARNQMRNTFRSERRRATLLDRARRLESTEPGEAEGDETLAGNIAESLAALSDADREVLQLIAWDGLDAAQAADILGCTPGALRVRLHRARRRMTEQLERRPAPSDEE